MEERVRQLGFVPAGRIVMDDADALAFTLNQEFTGAGLHARKCGWVYFWAKTDSANRQFDIVYVGKAGNTLRNRCGQHTNGFLNFPTGRRHAERIREHLRADAERHQLQVYARKSPDIELLGETGISMCEAEERAMIALCLRRNLPLWNYQTALQRNRPDGNAEAAYQADPIQHLPNEEQAAEAGVEQIAEEEYGGDEQGGLSREDAFMASIANFPEAEVAVAELLNALVDRHDIEVHYTFTNGADLRVRCLAQRGRDINVAIIWRRSKRDGRLGFGAYLYLSPQASLGAGATEACDPPNGEPSNVRSQAFFQIPDARAAMVAAVLQSIDAFQQEAHGRR